MYPLYEEPHKLLVEKIIGISSLILLQIFRQPVLVSETGFIYEFYSTDPVPVNSIPITLNIILPAGKVPHEISEIHEAKLVPEKISQILSECRG